MSVEWKCAGCGIESTSRARSCPCPTDIVYRHTARGLDQEWKVDSRDRAEGDLRTGIEHYLDEMMLAAENYFGALNPKRDGHIHATLEAIIQFLNANTGAP